MTHRNESELAALREEYLNLLDGAHNEQTYQSFIEQNTELVPRAFIQNHGIHLDMVIRKLSLAKDYSTDFFYLAKSSNDWNCVLVEIEKPHSLFFKPGTLDLHDAFYGALDQIHRWRAWFEERGNFDGFVNGTIRPLRQIGRLVNNPCHIKYVLVMGRRAEVENNEDRQRRLRVHQNPADFKIISFDGLIEALHTKNRLNLAVRKNEYYEIRNKDYIGEYPFVAMPPERLRISQELRQDILRHRGDWRHYESFEKLTLDAVLPRILDF